MAYNGYWQEGDTRRTPVGEPKKDEVKVSAENGMSLSCRVGVWWWGCAALGRRKWAGGDRLTEEGLVWGGSVALGRVDGRMRDGWKGPV